MDTHRSFSTHAGTLATAIMLLGATSAAHAGQSHSAGDFQGTYDLVCEQANFTLHFDLAGIIGGRGGNFHADMSVTLPCEQDAPEIATIAADVRDRCLAANFPAWACVDLESQAAEALAGTAALVPNRVDLTVFNLSDWIAKYITGIYPARGAHTFDDGRKLSWNYLLDNNDGWNSGHIFMVAMTVFDGIMRGHVGCATAAIGGIDGHIRRSDGFSVDASFLVDGGLYCVGVSGTDVVFGNIGLAFHGEVSGSKR